MTDQLTIVAMPANTVEIVSDETLVTVEQSSTKLEISAFGSVGPQGPAGNETPIEDLPELP